MRSHNQSWIIVRKYDDKSCLAKRPCLQAGSRPVTVVLRILKITNRACQLIQLANTNEVLPTYHAGCCRSTETNVISSEHLVCTRYFMYIAIIDPHKNSVRLSVLCLNYIQENQHLKKSSDLFKIHNY